MKRHTMFAAVAAVCLAMSSAAFAQNVDRGHDGRDRPGERGEQQRGNDDHDRRDEGRRNDRDERSNYQGNGRNDRYDYHVRDNDERGERGAGPRHDMRKGARLSREYGGNQYVVSDWRGHRLTAPPRGYHWVQTGNDYVLVAITTGIIMQILLNN